MGVPGERWLELRLSATGATGAADPADGAPAAELLVEALLEAGGRAVWEEDGWQVSHLPDPGDAAAVQATVDRVRSALGGLAGLEVETRWQRQEDWAEYWKRGLDARRLTDRIVVTPTWIEPETRAGDLVVVLDPKMAFGNAEHGTTRGCIRLLDGLVSPGDRLLDVGAGSAILAIVAALLGAERVDALEADPLAMPAAEENVERNGVTDRVQLQERRVADADLQALEPRDGVMANMETGFLRPLLGGLIHATRPGGWLLLSGILEEEWPDLRDEVEARGLGLRALDRDDGWCSAVFGRPGG